jgi:hypothetical protein
MSLFRILLVPLLLGLATSCAGREKHVEDHRPPPDPGGGSGLPFVKCTPGRTGCRGMTHDACSSVSLVCPPAPNNYCQAVLNTNNTCVTGETKSCPLGGGPALDGITHCEEGPSSCGWSRCKHCGARGEPCCNPPNAACTSGTCGSGGVASGTVVPTCM